MQIPLIENFTKNQLKAFDAINKKGYLYLYVK
jgi:hypothetical protein